MNYSVVLLLVTGWAWSLCDHQVWSHHWFSGVWHRWGSPCCSALRMLSSHRCWILSISFSTPVQVITLTLLDFMGLINDCLHLFVRVPSPWHFWDKPHLVLAPKSSHIARHGLLVPSQRLLHLYLKEKRNYTEMFCLVWQSGRWCLPGVTGKCDWEVSSFSPSSQKNLQSIAINACWHA